MISKKYMLILGLLIAVVGATSAKNRPLPPGSYKATCKNIKWGGRYGKRLEAACRDSFGGYNRYAYFYPHLCGYDDYRKKNWWNKYLYSPKKYKSNRDIANQNGNLVCGAPLGATSAKAKPRPPAKAK